MAKLEINVGRSPRARMLRQEGVLLTYAAFHDADDSADPAFPFGALHNALARLDALGPLTDDGLRCIRQAALQRTSLRATADLPIPHDTRIPLLILSGWAGLVRRLQDGRKQVVRFLFPGDFVHFPVAGLLEAMAFTPLQCCHLPATRPADLDHIIETSRVMYETHLTAHIIRNGRMSAEEAVADLLLEMFDRLKLCGLLDRLTFALPIKQDLIADALGLNYMQVNRTLQQLRNNGDIVLEHGTVTIVNPDELAGRIGHVWIGPDTPS